MRSRLRSYWKRLTGGSSGETTPGLTSPADTEVATSDSWEPNEEVNPEGFDPDELDDRTDVVTETGLTPRQFLERLIEEQGGTLRQQAFTDYTDWSEATVSRLLQEMEDDGEIVRVEVGNEKVVCLPEHVSDADPDGGDEPHDP